MFLLVLFLTSAIFNQASSLSSMFDPITFSFPSFNAESCTNGDLICMGSVSGADGHLKLTPEPEEINNNSRSRSPLPYLNKVGRVLYAFPVLAWPAMISTAFTVRISTFPNTTATGSGDGMSFVIAQDSKPSPPASFGSYLGLLDRSTQGILFYFFIIFFPIFIKKIHNNFL